MSEPLHDEWWRDPDNEWLPDVEMPDNPEVGRLFGPDGALIAIIRARSEIPFGFQGSAP